MKGTFHRYSTGKKIKVILAHAFLAVLAVACIMGYFDKFSRNKGILQFHLFPDALYTG